MQHQQLRPPVKWHGGKHYLAKLIVSLFPAHNTYIEPFGGAASVLLNKSPAPVEVYNDLDGAITRLFRVLRDSGDEFQRRLSLTPYSEEEFSLATQPPPPGADEIELARRDFVRWRQSLGGQGKAFSYTLHRSRRGMADVVSGYLSAIDIDLPQIVGRLRQVQILNRPAIEVIKKWDDKDAVIYCDPPYVHSTRNARTTDVYGKEMSDSEHVALANVLSEAQATVVVSGYPSKLYDQLFSGWEQIEVEVPNHASLEEVKAKQREVLWLKRTLTKPEITLFSTEA